jgi:hypothetical protein
VASLKGGEGYAKGIAGRLKWHTESDIKSHVLNSYKQGNGSRTQHAIVLTCVRIKRQLITLVVPPYWSGVDLEEDLRQRTPCKLGCTALRMQTSPNNIRIRCILSRFELAPPARTVGCSVPVHGRNRLLRASGGIASTACACNAHKKTRRAVRLLLGSKLQL